MLTRTHTFSHKINCCWRCSARLVMFGALIYIYERYYRGPTDSILVGTWEMTMPYRTDLCHFGKAWALPYRPLV